MEEGLYRSRGHLPPVDDLPWSEEYLRPPQSPAGASAAKEGSDKASRERSRQEFLSRFTNSRPE
jgi:hypothetical protein